MKRCSRVMLLGLLSLGGVGVVGGLGGCVFAEGGGGGGGLVLVDQVEPGMTREEVRGLLGEPDERVQMSADQEWWGYVGESRPASSALQGAGVIGRSAGSGGVRILFNAEGRVERVQRGGSR